MKDAPDTPCVADCGTPWKIRVPWAFSLAAQLAGIEADVAMFLILKYFGQWLSGMAQEAMLQSAGLLAILTILILARPLGNLPGKLGLGWPRWCDFGLVALGLCMAYNWNFVSTFLWEKLLNLCHLAVEQRQQMLVDCGRASLKQFLAMVALAGVLIPIVEEVTFRRVMYGVFRPLGILPAMFLTSLIFSAMHFFIHGFPALFGFGLVLQWQYIHGRNLLIPILTHMIFNIIALTMAFSLGQG